MHHNSRTIVIAVSILFLVALLTSLVGRPLARTLRLAASDPIVEPVKEIAGYRNWTKVNTEPQLMHRQAAIDCSIRLSPAFEVVDGETNPHREKYITVYVNAIGREAMMEKLKPIFPVGSVIVKEKLPERSSQSPELLTVMIKREKGFNSETGDWELWGLTELAARLRREENSRIVRAATWPNPKPIISSAAISPTRQ